MARYSKGILGAFSGTVGTVVGSKWKGIEYMRSKSGKKNSTPTPAQEVHRAKFSLVGKFIQSMSGLFPVTFKDYANQMTGSNYVFSYTMENVVTGDYPDLKLDYNLALIAKGSLPNAEKPSAVKDGTGVIKFNWMDNSGSGFAKPNDKAIMVAYCEELNQCQFKLAGANRAAGTDSLNVPAFSGKQVHTWLAFISETGEDVATSIYTGVVTVD
ncbi:MAG TPA: DUF6266 family protein [Chitinophagaceae bacterium]|jgi:hypothetical protein|nr:DUF6266 family protein [Chitinophagaceae bacterium]